MRYKEDYKTNIWFNSIESFAQILSTRNTELLKLIKEKQPETMTQLAFASGRELGNLSRTLKKMEKYGIVELIREKRSIKPIVKWTSFNAEISL